MKKYLLIFTVTFISAVSFCQTKISADSANSYVGKEVTVCSQVFEVRTFDKLTLLRLGAAYPNSPLTVTIPADSATFDVPLTNYDKRNICVTGTVKLYKGKPEIVVTKQDQITFEAPEAVIRQRK